MNANDLIDKLVCLAQGCEEAVAEPVIVYTYNPIGGSNESGIAVYDSSHNRIGTVNLETGEMTKCNS